eukprot:m.229416 g.229416  ORF g.229416 m.229416 type:complete len:265 (+) comp11903_c0_seq1:28-822(+)
MRDSDDPLRAQLRPPALTALLLAIGVAVYSFGGFESVQLHVQADEAASPYRVHVNSLIGKYNITILNDDPLLYIIDDFLTERECNAIMESTGGLERSTGGLERSITSYRTSSTAWINTEAITNATSRSILTGVEERIAELTALPVENQEHFQVLNYQVGQYYKLHNDYIPQHRYMPCGVRIATFFLYLSEVPEGGGTSFPAINIVVQPRRGRAAVWYSALPGSLDIDTRVDHEAMPVLQGEKWAANKWIHAGNFADNWKKGLTG